MIEYMFFPRHENFLGRRGAVGRQWLVVLFFAGWFATLDQSVTAQSIALPLLKLRQTDGNVIELGDDPWTVVAFLGTECPLAKLYGPRLQNISDEFGSQGVRVLGVVSNVQDSPAEIDAYVKTHGIAFGVVKDSDQSVMEAFGATRTPEVFVVDSSGRIRYQGRIDDQYQPGVTRAAPKKHDLRDAISSLCRDKDASVQRTKAVGCLMTRIPGRANGDSSKLTSVTFTRDVAPILHRHCVECHRKGEIGPMQLTDYDDVVGWGQMMLEVIDEKRMPPWHADPDVGEFIGAREFPAKDRQTIADWIDQGLPEGDASDLPSTPAWESGWHLPSSPDITLVMRDRPFDVPADGVVEYQYFVVDPEWTEDRWLRAAQVVPGNSSVVHHAIVFVRPPDGSDLSGVGWLGAYVPGQRTFSLPPGHARLVPAGSKLVFQMHYTPNGNAAQDLTKVGIWKVDPNEVSHEVLTKIAINHEFEIPPGVKDYEVTMAVDHFPPNGRMLGITPHMHLRGKSFELVAQPKPGHPKTGQPKPLLRVPNYDFNWQHWYAFKSPVDLHSVESLEMKVVFDNSRYNPFNPGPDDYVSWGDQTWEEMAIAFYDVAIPRGGPRSQSPQRHRLSKSESKERLAKINRHVQTFLEQMDTNGDGVVEREETTDTFRRFGFNRLDRNRDRRIDRDELVKAAEQRL